MRTIDIIIGFVILMYMRKRVKKLMHPFNTLAFILVTIITVMYIFRK